MTTLIRNAAWIVAWDSSAGRHAYLRDADLAFDGDTITFVGRNYTSTASQIIDGRTLMLIPGLVDIHSHPSTEPFFRGISQYATVLPARRRWATGGQDSRVLRNAAHGHHHRR